MARNKLKRMPKDKDPSPVVYQGAAVKYSGPLPPPGLLQGYGDIEKSFPERIMADFEKNSQHFREHFPPQNKEAQGFRRSNIIGRRTTKSLFSVLIPTNVSTNMIHNKRLFCQYILDNFLCSFHNDHPFRPIHGRLFHLPVTCLVPPLYG